MQKTADELLRYGARMGLDVQALWKLMREKGANGKFDPAKWDTYMNILREYAAQGLNKKADYILPMKGNYVVCPICKTPARMAPESFLMPPLKPYRIYSRREKEIRAAEAKWRLENGFLCSEGEFPKEHYYQWVRMRRLEEEQYVPAYTLQNWMPDES